MRLFIAIELTPEARAHAQAMAAKIAELQPDLARQCRWVKPEQFHITLQFLGECPETQLTLLKNKIRDTAQRHSAFDYQLGDVGNFNKGKSFKVLWVGIEEGKEALAMIARELDPENKNYHPHVTLARSKYAVPTADIQSSLKEMPLTPMPPARATSIALVQSVLSAGGSTYSTLYRAPLH